MYPRPSMQIGAGWKMPPAAQVGGGGTLIRSGSFWTAAGMGDNTFAYIVRPVTAGRYYWEFEKLADHIFPGIADSTGSAGAFGGYTASNAGIYSANGSLWREAAWGGSFSVGSVGSLANGDIVGLAYDADAGHLEVFVDGVSVSEITFSSPPATVWAHAGFQATGSGRFRLGPAGCAYPRPTGYRYL